MNWLYEYILDLMNTLVVILFRRNIRDFTDPIIRGNQIFNLLNL